MAIAIVLVMRLVVPLSIFRWPLVGGILAIIADTVDILFFQWLGFPSIGYHELDKLLDTYYLAIEVIVAQRWTTLPRATATGLFIYRATGVALFEFTHDRTMLLIFPNLFEFYFLFHAARLRYARIPDLRFQPDLCGTRRLAHPEDVPGIQPPLRTLPRPRRRPCDHREHRTVRRPHTSGLTWFSCDHVVAVSPPSALARQ